MLSILQLCIVFLTLIPRSLGLRSVELSEVALIVVEALRVLMDDVGGYRIEESSVVRSVRKSAAWSLGRLDRLTRLEGYLAKSADSLPAKRWHLDPAYWKARPA